MRRSALFPVFLLSVSILLPLSAAGKCVADRDYIQDSAERERLIEKAEKERRHVRRVEFAGNVNTPDWDIRKRIFLNEGDLFTRDRLERSLEAVSNLNGLIGPVDLDSVKMWEDDDEPVIDISIHFLEERTVSRRSELVNGDIYAQAVYSVLKRMKLSYEGLIADDFSRAIVIKRGGLTSKIPGFFDGFGVEVLDRKEIAKRELKTRRGQIPVFEINRFVKLGGFLRVRVHAFAVSSKETEMTFSPSDWGDVYFVYDSDRDSLVVHEVCLRGT